MSSCSQDLYSEKNVQRLVLSLTLIMSGLIPLTTASAQTPFANREPGLWELRLVDGSSLASLALGVEQAFKNLPEAQRRQMERLMGSSSVKMPTVIQQCLTPELARSDAAALLAEHDIKCSKLDWQEAGDGGTFAFACTGPDGDFTGEGRIFNASPRRFNSEASVQGKYKGQPAAMDMKHEARWISADCGNVKPAR